MTAVTDEHTDIEVADYPDFPEQDRIAAILDDVALIDDPVERCGRAAHLDKVAAHRESEARAVRDNAAMVAHIDFGVQPVLLYRGALGGLSRGLFNRMVQRANSVSPLPALRATIPHSLATREDAISLARDAATTVRVYDVVGTGARKIRDDTGRGLMNGDYGTPMSNADFSRLTGLSSARAAQIRYGKNGHNPRRR